MKASRAHIDHLHPRFVGLLQEDIFWLEVAVHDVVLAQEDQTVQDLDCDFVDEVQRHPLVAALSQHLVEVDVEELEYEAGVASEKESVFELDDVGLELRVAHYHRLEDLDLHLGLFVELGFVADDLQRH